MQPGKVRARIGEHERSYRRTPHRTGSSDTASFVTHVNTVLLPQSNNTAEESYQGKKTGYGKTETEQPDDSSKTTLRVTQTSDGIPQARTNTAGNPDHQKPGLRRLDTG